MLSELKLVNDIQIRHEQLGSKLYSRMRECTDPGQGPPNVLGVVMAGLGCSDSVASLNSRADFGL